MNLELQKLVFNPNVSRRELLSYNKIVKSDKKIQVFRNHSFEFVEHIIAPYLEYAGVGITFSYSGYDDSFSFFDLDDSADAYIVWFDATRYNIDVVEFLRERIQKLRDLTDKYIIVVPVGCCIEDKFVDVDVYELASLQSKYGDEFYDDRSLKISGTRVNRKVLQEIAFNLGMVYIPAILGDEVKAIVVDFDNTLYSGVIGEDGIDGIVINENHIGFQTKLKKYAESGGLLCGASKNVKEDVDSLLDNNSEMVLRKSDFTKIIASWDSKAQMLKEIKEYLNIGTSNILFIDDNVGELTTVTSMFPDIKVFLADEMANNTNYAIDYYPGLYFKRTAEDGNKRKIDIQANENRRIIKESVKSVEEYIQALDIHLTFKMDDELLCPRMAELANKTNQFIFNYKRYNQVQFEKMVRADDYAVVAVELKDKISDSGMIATCVGHYSNGRVEIEEFFMSCRALGRNIEGVIITQCIEYCVQKFNCKNVLVDFVDGPKNEPAKKMANSIIPEILNKNGCFNNKIDTYSINIERK